MLEFIFPGRPVTRPAHVKALSSHETPEARLPAVEGGLDCFDALKPGVNDALFLCDSVTQNLLQVEFYLTNFCFIVVLKKLLA